YPERKDLPPYEEDPTFYWFVLTKYHDWSWHITEMTPEPKPGERSLHILPEDIADRMIDTAVDPEKIITLNALHSEASKCFYEIQYVRYSPNNIFGTIQENLQLKNEKYAQIDVTPEEKMDAALQILSYCNTHYPDVARMFIDGMFELALPYIEAEENLKKAEEMVTENQKPRFTWKRKKRQK
ncbi:MAG: hypothetical protein GY950_28920, partial [bacterium]|nr:hypothetical protein [bacterium]